MRPSTIPNRSLMTYARSKLTINKHADNFKIQKEEPGIWNQTRNLSEGSKAIGGAASIGNNVKLRFVFFLVNTNNKHGCIFAWGRNHNLLGTTLITTKSNITLISNYSIIFLDIYYKVNSIQGEIKRSKIQITTE